MYISMLLLAKAGRRSTVRTKCDLKGLLGYGSDQGSEWELRYSEDAHAVREWGMVPPTRNKMCGLSWRCQLRVKQRAIQEHGQGNQHCKSSVGMRDFSLPIFALLSNRCRSTYMKLRVVSTDALFYRP